MNPRTSNFEQWIAEASHALAEAERLTGLLALAGPRHDLTLASLQAEIMGLRSELERLRRERAGDRRRDFQPEWMEYSVWQAPVR